MKVLTKYIDNRVRALNVILEKPRSRYTPGTFHQLRVEIKKLNAVFDLLKYCSKDFNRKKTIKPFKLIFRQAGKVRELQLEETLLKKYQINNSLSNYLTILKYRRLKARDVFFTLVNEEFTSLLNKRIQKISPFLSGVKTKRVNKYLDQQTKNIKKLIRKNNLLPEQLHELRIKLKMLNYNRKSLSLEPQHQKKDALPLLLGKWHDLQVMCEHLQKTIETEGLQRKEILQLEKIIAFISVDSEMLFDRIIQAIPKSEFAAGHHNWKDGIKSAK